MTFQRSMPAVGTHSIKHLEENYKDYLPAGARTIVGFDTETWKIANNVVPKPVCYTFFDLSNAGYQTPKGYIYNAQDGAAHLKQLLLDDEVHIVIHNAAFDAAVCSVQDTQLFALITRAYKKGRIHCTKIRQAISIVAETTNYGDMNGTIQCEGGNMSFLSLAGCVKIYFDADISNSKQADSWRLRYRELDGVPIDEWDVAAVDYAISDAHYAAMVFLAQEAEARMYNARVNESQNRNDMDILFDAPRQAFAEFVLHHMSSTHGITINESSISVARDAVMQEHKKLLPVPMHFGVYQPAPTKDRGVGMNKATFQAVFFRVLELVEATDVPEYYSDAKYVGNLSKISTAEDRRKKLLYTVNRCLSTGSTIQTAKRLTDAEREELEVLRNIIDTTAHAEGKWKEFATFLTAIERGKLNPDNRLRFQMNGLVATGRTSSKKPNLQNLPRAGAARSCIEPAEGHVFLISDYSAAEFRTLAQCIEDEDPENGSEIARQYRADRSFDPHLFAAARMWELEHKEEMPFDKAKEIYADDENPKYKQMKHLRTLAKILNFGLAGGLSHISFVSYARGYGIELSVDQSEKLCRMWLNVWHEMNGYFDRRKFLTQADRMTGEFTIENPDARIYVFDRDKRARYCNRFTVMCNTPFQGVAASGCKEALINIFEECYFKRKSPLFGAFPVLMVHDEIVLEAPYDGTAEGLIKLRRAAARFEELMIAGMEKYTPNVPAEAEVAISTRWTKDAKSARDENGELLVWSPKEGAVGSEDEEDATNPIEQLTVNFPQGVQLAKQNITRLLS